MFKKLKSGLAVTIAMLIVISMLQDGIFKVQAAEGDKTTLYIDDGFISISGDTAKYNSLMNTVTNPNGFIIAQHDSTSPTFWSISVTGGNADITLQNVNISEKCFDFGCAFTIAPGSSVNLTLNGNNRLESSSLSAGICVPSGAELSINGTDSDSLTVIGGGNAAGIGGGYNKAINKADDSDCGTVNIFGGIVTATGSAGGAGIGGGLYGSGGTVNISGGTVTATGGEGAAGIGGGRINGKAGVTTITGGSVHAIDCNGNNSIQGSVKDSSGNIEHCVTVDTGTLIGSSRSLSASVQSGAFSRMQTDSSEKLYFWMNENATNSATVQYDSNFYKLSVAVGTADTGITLKNDCQMTVLDLSQENIEIGVSSITAKDINNQPASLNPNGYVIMQSAEGSTANMISVNDGTQNIVLQNVNVATTNKTAFYIAEKASLNLSLYGTNTLKSSGFLGFMVPPGASLNINGGDSLSVSSGRSYNGIGGSGNECGTICINGGTISAYGGDYGTGIGDSVTINGGNVTAVGYSGCAGIGGQWACSCGTVVINGGNVTAIGNRGGAGIGGSYQAGYGGTIIINGGNVSATGDVGAGIGGGGQGGCGGSVTITGGNVRAVGNRGGAGIGGGQGIVRTYGNGDTGGSGGNVTISGGTVTAIGTSGAANIGGGGPGGRGGSCGDAAITTITGGSVCSSIQGTPTNGTDSVYMTTVSIPLGKEIENLKIRQGGNNYAYGYKDMQTDNSTYGKVCLWLPVNGENLVTTADVVSDKGSYTGYHGTVGIGNNNILKMDQSALIIGGIRSGGKYTYGSVPSATAGGGSGTGSLTYSYIGSNYDSSIKPTDTGAYDFTVKKAEDACYYAATKTASFEIIPKELGTLDITFTIPVQEYTGSALTPDIHVSYNGTVLVKGTDYTVSYINNVDIAQSTDLNPPTMTITFTGNYSGIVSETFTIEAAPTINVSHVPDDLDSWSSKVVFSVTATAGSSGLKSVIVKKDTETTPTDITDSFNNGKYSFIATENCAYTFTVTSNSGFTASQTLQTGKIDTVAPAIGNISGNPESPVPSAALHFEATAGTSGIESVMVSGPQGDKNITYTYQDGYVVAQNGTYTFTVTNNAGVSVSSAPVVVTNIDNVKPVVVIDSNGYTDGTWVNHDVILSISNSSPNLGTTTYEYSTDGETWKAFGGSFTVRDETATTYRFRATSASGIVSEIQSITVKTDKTAPAEMVITFKQNPFKTVLHFQTFGIFFDDTVDVNLSATDNGSGIDHYEYQLVAEADTAGASWQTGALSISPEFKGTLYARAIDKAGNYSGIATKSLIVDKTAPTITTSESTLTTTSPSAAIPVTVEDNGAGVGIVTYQVNAGSVQTIDATENVSDYIKKYSFSIESLPDGIYDVVINAQDNSGNSADSVTVHVNKDTTPKVFNVQVTPDTISLDHGAVQTFAAAITGINSPPTEIKWSVSGNRSIGTTIDANGKLTVAVDESSSALTITATSVYDETKSKQVNVVVNTADQTGFTFASSTITKTYGDAPFSIDALGGQGYESVSYKVTSGEDVIFIEGNTVTVNKAGTAFITATKAADGSFRQATAGITLYIGKGMPEVLKLPEASELNVVGRLSTCNLTGGSANIPGTFTWTDLETIVTKTGNYEATFIPNDTTKYNSCTCMVKVTVNPIIYNSLSGVAFDLSGVTLPDNVTFVSVGSSVEPKSNNGSVYSLIEKQIGNEKKLNNLVIYNLKLLDQDEKPIETFAGKIKVRIPIPNGMSGELHVYWYNDANGTVTDMNARQENGYLVFDTDHFSFYAVTEVSAKASSGSGSVPNPKTGSYPLQFVPAWLGASGFVLTVVTSKRRSRKKR